MTDPAVLKRIATRRSELDGLEEQLAMHLEKAHAERDELAVAEKVPARLSEKVAAVQASTAPVSAQVGERGAPPVPHRAPGVDKGALPPAYLRILAVVQEAAGPVMTQHVGEALGLDTEVRGALEPLRAKLTKLADRGRLRPAAASCGQLRKLPDGKFTARL
ncbi:hypothetical protein [Streptomyces mirabilis]|uniref:hypothetical protein n=1 Tax=Streptomyces mirabilis TaxID=68239 RepID=UPI00332CF1E0